MTFYLLLIYFKDISCGPSTGNRDHSFNFCLCEFGNTVLVSTKVANS
jgi:hypothetical protein